MNDLERQDWIRRGLMTPNGELTEAGEQEAEARARARKDYIPADAAHDHAGAVHGLAPDPFPGGSIA